MFDGAEGCMVHRCKARLCSLPRSVDLQRTCETIRPWTLKRPNVRLSHPRQVTPIEDRTRLPAVLMRRAFAGAWRSCRIKLSADSLQGFESNVSRWACIPCYACMQSITVTMTRFGCQHCLRCCTRYNKP